ncbi:MAG TPA: aminotransferase class V-fold PLP-dependent enzyme [Polyangiales bacterium]|nr:aminotransferase class V-fold PLP-dependent enzyme [Polyangiales bacterium]
MTFAHTLESIVADEALRRAEFPVVADKIYLAHAAVCPLAACVVRALAAYLEQVGRGGQFEHLHAQAEQEARALAAAMIGASPDEIAFVSSTSAGLSLIAAGLSWQRGDSVVIAQGDFPSNVYPWLRLERLGVRVKTIASRDDRGITLDDVIAQLDDSTRLVALSTVHFATGARTALDAIGRELEQRGVLFCVDAIQSLGAGPTSAKHVDFMVADGHKWLLGPQGIGIMFVRRSRFELLEPLLVGWKSMRDSRDFVQQRLDFADSARRYEPGSLNALGLIGLHAALDMLQRVGIEAIAKRLAVLRARLVPALLDKGYDVLARDADSSIVSFRSERRDVANLHRSLDAQQIITSLRQDPHGRDCLRLAPHFYNDEREIDRLLSLL